MFVEVLLDQILLHLPLFFGGGPDPFGSLGVHVFTWSAFDLEEFLLLEGVVQIVH